jgi:hypothetical protein
MLPEFFCYKRGKTTVCINVWQITHTEAHEDDRLTLHVGENQHVLQGDDADRFQKFFTSKETKQHA